MIRFTNTNNNVQVVVTVAATGKEYQMGQWNCNNDPLYSILLQERLETQLSKNLQSIREEAYNDGYKDGRAKRAKKTWFKSWW